MPVLPAVHPYGRVSAYLFSLLSYHDHRFPAEAKCTPMANRPTKNITKSHIVSFRFCQAQQFRFVDGLSVQHLTHCAPVRSRAPLNFLTWLYQLNKINIQFRPPIVCVAVFSVFFFFKIKTIENKLNSSAIFCYWNYCDWSDRVINVLLFSFEVNKRDNRMHFGQ